MAGLSSKHVAYAYLKAIYNEKSGNVLVLVNGLILSVLPGEKGARFSYGEIADKVESKWGIRIPGLVCKHSLSKLQGEGILGFDDVVHKNYIKSEKSIKEESKTKETQARESYNRLKKAVAAEALREGVNLGADEIIDRFLEKRSVSFFASSGNISWQDQDDRMAMLVIARAIGLTPAGKYNKSIAEDLSNVVFGDVLFRTVIAISEVEHFDKADSPDDFLLDKKMMDVDVYLDTGIIFRALGFFGDEMERAAIEMLNISIETGCKLKVFSHTVDEVKEGLLAVAGNLARRGEAFGPIVSYISENGIDQSDLIERVANFDAEVRSLGIEVIEKPPVPDELRFSELELDHRIEVDVKQNNPRARQRDVDSLHSIYALRNGEQKKYLERCDAIFITSNTSLAFSANRFFKDLFKLEGTTNIVQVCMTDSVFTSRLWVKLPTSHKDLPRSQIVVYALSHLQPEPQVKKRFHDELQKLQQSGEIDATVATLVRISRFTDLVIALDFGRNASAVTKDEILPEVRRIIEMQKNELDRMRKAESSSIARQHQNNIDELNKEMEKIIQEKNSAVDEFNEFKRNRNSQMNDIWAAKRASEMFSDKLVSIISNGVICLAALSVLTPLAGALATRYISAETAAIVAYPGAAVLTLMSLVGFNVIGATRFVQNKIRRILERLISS